MSKGQGTEPGLGRRVVVTTTVSRETHDFFNDHPEFVVGRCLDKWVEGQLADSDGAEAERWAKRLAAFDLGSCRCGRNIYASKRRSREECPGCQKPGKECDCQPTLDLRRRQLVEWQAARSSAGMRTDGEDLKAKQEELGLIPKEKPSAYILSRKKP